MTDPKIVTDAPATSLVGAMRDARVPRRDEYRAWQDAQEEFARQRRDLHTQQLIDEARGPVVTPHDEAEVRDRTLTIQLEGEGARVYERFRLAAKALATHQTTGTALMEEYRAALAELSASAAGEK